MEATKRNNIINGTLAIIWLILWLLFCRFFFTGDSGSGSRSVTEYGLTREIVSYDRNPLKREYTILLVAGVYGAAIASLVVYRTRSKPDRALYVFLIAPATAVISGILLLMLSTAIFNPGDPSLYGNEITRRLFPALGIGVVYGLGLSIFTGIPALLAALATSQFLKAFSGQIIPQRLPS